MILFITLLQFWSSPCETISIEDEIKKRDLIVIALIHDNPNYVVNDPVRNIFIVDFFKGHGSQHLAVDQINLNLKSGTYYLIFASYNQYDGYYIAECSKTAELDQIEQSTLDYLYTNLGFLPCYDSEIRKEREGSACERIYKPVCGCNGVTFGNSCEANKYGIMKYIPGKCK